MATRDFDDVLNGFLSDDDNFKTYIDTAFDEYLNGEKDNLILIIRHLIEKHGVQNVVREAKISRATLYKSFSEKGNPTFNNLNKVLASVGYELTIRPVRKNADVAAPRG